jgi:ketosteroid isomerase-like protein
LCSKKESSIREARKNKEIIRASFSVAPQTVEVTAIRRDKVLVKVEQNLNFWVEDRKRKRVPADGNVLRQTGLTF